MEKSLLWEKLAVQVTLYTRPGCHLCEEAKKLLLPLLEEVGLGLTEVNVETDPCLQRRFGEEVPVVFVGSRKVAKHRINPEEFRKVLERHLLQERTQ